MEQKTGSFTLPGESGYEELTMRLAEKWGADVIRDSDGTQLSDEIISAGYGVYSTICPIRNHNEWLKRHPDMQQQTFLVTSPQLSVSTEMTIILMKDFFAEQFMVNSSEEALEYWQVYDRTTGEELSREQWEYHPAEGTVDLHDISKWHRYTVSFLAYRIWEEISMYNQLTNGWKKEHLMQIDPRYKEAQQYLLRNLEKWCKEHPCTTVVRFTSLFYNFVWIWGRDERRKEIFCDWASYDFTVSPKALKEFEREYGYRLTAEDFVNQGKYHVTHMLPDKKKLDYMRFTNDFVICFGKQLVDIVHRYNKKAYLFYDDSWVGTEPYGEKFREFGFDGIIKAAFSGFEARLCAGVETEVHELRLHPYLFPTGVDGSPSFLPEGMPEKEAQEYWINIRRALLRQPVERIGLGGYLHLVEKKPEFEEYIQVLADEFRTVKSIHQSGKPVEFRTRIGVLHAWGKLRSWTCSGHFHENKTLDLMNILESLSGLPFQVEFLSFADITEEKLGGFDVIINAGIAGSAWSGGKMWDDPEIVSRLTRWVYDGGVFFGVNEPSASDGGDRYFKMAHVLGVDRDRGDFIRHGKWKIPEIASRDYMLIPSEAEIPVKQEIYLTDPNCMVLRGEDKNPSAALHRFGKGAGVYLGGYRHSNANERMLQNLILYACGDDPKQELIPDNYNTECAYYPAVKTLLVVNNTCKEQRTHILFQGGEREYVLKAGEMIADYLVETDEI